MADRHYRTEVGRQSALGYQWLRQVQLVIMLKSEGLMEQICQRQKQGKNMKNAFIGVALLGFISLAQAQSIGWTPVTSGSASSTSRDQGTSSQSSSNSWQSVSSINSDRKSEDTSRVTTTYWQSGNSTYGSDGSTSQRVGNTNFNSDGSRSTQIGSTQLNSDGSTVQKVGDNYFGSDGKRCTTVGSQTVCN